MSLETGSSGDFRKVTFNCTCSGHAFGAKSAKNQVELNFSSSFTMPVPHAALLHFRRIPRRGPGCVSFRAACRVGGGSGICGPDRKSTRLNSSHANISYAVFCLKKKKKNINTPNSNRNKSHCWLNRNERSIGNLQRSSRGDALTASDYLAYHSRSQLSDGGTVEK